MATAQKTPAPHRWRFYRAGGVDQVRIETAQDILHLEELDQKLWVALSCPVTGLEFDERTLALLDGDKDGRVRVPEILAAVRWLRGVLKRPECLVEHKDGVALTDIDASTKEGARVLAAAQHILTSLGKTDGLLTVADATRTAEVLSRAEFNGDGVVVPTALDDTKARAVAEELLATVGGTADRSGGTGYDRAGLVSFYAGLEALVAWQAEADADPKTLLPLGAGTGAAADAVAALRTKVQDYFARCQLVAFDARAQAALNREESLFLALAAKDLTISAEEIQDFPLAAVAAAKPLPLVEGVNPAWSAAVTQLRETLVAPLLGKDKTSLTHAEWRGLCATLSPFEAWMARRPGHGLHTLGAERAKAILGGSERALLEAAIDADLAEADAVNASEDAERLARYVTHFHSLLLNFVNFSDFYARRQAIFDVGTLYLDGRSLDLCVAVSNPGKHATLAPMSKALLVYVDCTRPCGEKRQIAAAFTAGDNDNLFVGRNGLFYDRQGRDWDATIAKIVDNPISVAQAFWSPYKKALRWIEEQVAKRAAAADEAANAKLQASAATAGTAVEKGAAPAAPKKMDIGVLAAISVAISGVSIVLGGLMEGFFGLGHLMPLGLLGLVLLISGPSMVIAWLKLRQRNLGPLLDANGWAVNALTKVNIPLGRSLTQVREIPEGAERTLRDPYAPPPALWPRVLFVLVLLGAAGYGSWWMGWIHDVWPNVPYLEDPSVKREEDRKNAAKAKADAEKAAAEAAGAPAETTPPSDG